MISIVIPTYEQSGKGADMLIVLLNSIVKQETDVEYEIVVSDNDTTGAIKFVCNSFPMLPIKYFRNPVRGASENFNYGFSMASGDKIKPMCMDDAFCSTNAITKFDALLKKYNWVIGNSVHINQSGNVYGVRRTNYIHGNFTKNVTGMPSVIAFKKCNLRFDTRLKTICDMYFYHQLYQLYGKPGVLTDFTVACRFWNGSLSRNQESRHGAEVEFLKKQKLI